MTIGGRRLCCVFVLDSLSSMTFHDKIERERVRKTKRERERERKRERERERD